MEINKRMKGIKERYHIYFNSINPSEIYKSTAVTSDTMFFRTLKFDRSSHKYILEISVVPEPHIIEDEYAEKITKIGELRFEDDEFFIDVKFTYLHQPRHHHGKEIYHEEISDEDKHGKINSDGVSLEMNGHTFILLGAQVESESY